MEEDLKQLRQQMASDFDFNCLALKEMGQQFRSGIEQTAATLQKLGREMEERFNQVEGRMRLQEHRLTRMLEVVESSAQGWKPELREIRARLDRLEQQAS